jgi:hypothetical protein
MGVLMKVFIYLFVFFNFNILLADDLPFTYERLNVDFYGVAYNSRTILAYGTGSAIVRSYDRGKTWDQVTVAHDSLSIRKIKNINESFYGVLDKSIIIKSVDDGKSWQVKKLEKDNDILDFDISKDYLYVLKADQIDVVDLDLNPVGSIPVDTSLHSFEIHIFNNTIYINSDSSRLITYDINDNYKTGQIDFIKLGLSTVNKSIRRLKDMAVSFLPQSAAIFSDQVQMANRGHRLMPIMFYIISWVIIYLI